MKAVKIIKLTLLSTSVIISSFLNAQELRPFRFGLKASPNIGWLKPDTRGINSNGASLGFNYGLMAEFTLGNSYNYGLGSGVEISTFSGKLEFPDVVAPIDTTLVNSRNSSSYTYRYVEIPFTIRMKTNEIGYNTYFANFGVSTSFRVRGRQNISYSLPTGNLNEENIDVLGEIAPFRFGLILGGGVEYNFHGKTALIAGITFNNGFSNIFKKDYYELNTNGEVLLNNNKPNQTVEQKAISNYISLDLGIFF